MEIFGHGTSLAREDNSFSLDPDVKDAWGLPALRITYKDHPDDLKLATLAQPIAPCELLEAAGAKKMDVTRSTNRSLRCHLLGTCRMGKDPKTSVINADHRPTT